MMSPSIFHVFLKGKLNDGYILHPSYSIKGGWCIEHPIKSEYFSFAPCNMGATIDCDVRVITHAS
jgi:hypothetical protein